MESKQKPIPASDYDSDKDINLILYKTAQAIKRGLDGIGRALVAFARSLGAFVEFLVRNLVWLLIGLVLGLAYGFYKYSKAGPQYASEMVVQTNFNSARPLYSTVDHLNILVGTANKAELSRIFRISNEEAGQIKNFSIEPVKNELIIADMYKHKFLQTPVDKHYIRQDTFWTRTIPYGEFKESLTTYDYPVHKITAVSYNQNIFEKLQNGITDKLLNNDLAERFKKAEAENNQTDITILGSAIAGLDTLRRTYNEKMIKGDNIPQIVDVKPGPQQNYFSFVAPELELYDRLLELKEELKNARRKSVTEDNIVEIQSNFTSPGKRVSLFEEDIFPSALLGLGVVFVALLLIQLFKLFLSFKERR